ncbi:hypothetical protein RVM27_03830 [Halomonas sp. KM007]
MFGLGVTIFIVGLFSFILPLFGRQFILITLFEMSGIQSIIAGLAFMVVGAILAMKAIKRGDLG